MIFPIHLQLSSFLLTIVTEVSLTAYFSRLPRMLLLSLLLNGITHPWAYLFWTKAVPIVLIEIIVITTEALGWWWTAKISLRKALLLSLGTNLFSYAIGVVYFQLI